MAIYKRGDIYWYKFKWKGQPIRQSTRQGNDKKARLAEAEHKTRLAEQDEQEEKARKRLRCKEVLPCHECEKLFNADKAVRREEKNFCSMKCATASFRAHTMPSLAEFIEHRFLPYAQTRHKDKPSTFRYYQQSSGMLQRSTLANLRLDELTDEHARIYAAEFAHLSASGINRGLRTLRRALNLAYDWKIIDKPIAIELAKGEVQRERVLSDKELALYLNHCLQPWRDCAIILAEEGMRPGEVFALEWQHILLSNDGSETGMIQIAQGKSKASRRLLPMFPAVYRVLKARYDAAGRPDTGYIFPSENREGHLVSDGLAKNQHQQALTDSGIQPFPPYTLRHTALTEIAEASEGDVFAVAKIAGHSSITITQRYVHPQTEAIERVFQKRLQLRSETSPTLLEAPSHQSG